MNLTQSVFLRIRVSALLIVFSSCLLLMGVRTILGQSFSSQDRDRRATMLKIIKDDISKHYYDPAFHAIDLDARFNLPESNINLTKSKAEVFCHVTRAVLDFTDPLTASLAQPTQTTI